MTVALAYHLVASSAYPNYFQTPDGPLSFSWPVGSPLTFGTWSATGEMTDFQPLALIADFLAAVVLVVGTAQAIDDWPRASLKLPVLNRNALIIVVASILGWVALFAVLRVPVAVFFGWAALAVIYLGVPCAAYSLVTRSRPSARFSMRTLLLVTTCICVVLAAIAWTRATRLADSKKRTGAPAFTERNR